VRIFVPDIGPTPPPRTMSQGVVEAASGAGAGAGAGADVAAFDCSINAGTIWRQLTEIWCV
jgi:hypothetical protein